MDRLVAQAVAASDPAGQTLAIYALSRTSDPRAVDALSGLLNKEVVKTVPRKVRLAAIRALGRLRAVRAVEAIRAAAKGHDPSLRMAALKALKRTCPPERGKRYYLDFKTIKVTGPDREWLKQAAQLKLRRLMLAHRGATVDTGGCKNSARRGFFRRPPVRYRVGLEVSVKGHGASQSLCRVEVMVITSKGVLRGTFSAKAVIDGPLSRLRLRQSVVGILDHLREDIHRSLSMR